MQISICKKRCVMQHSFFQITKHLCRLELIVNIVYQNASKIILNTITTHILINVETCSQVPIFKVITECNVFFLAKYTYCFYSHSYSIFCALTYMKCRWMFVCVFVKVYLQYNACIRHIHNQSTKTYPMKGRYWMMMIGEHT